MRENEPSGRNWRRWRPPAGQSGGAGRGPAAHGGPEKVPRLRLCGELAFRETKPTTKRCRDLAAAVTTENTNQMLCCQLCLVIIDRVGSIWMECLWVCLISQFSLSRSLSSSVLPFAVLWLCFNAKILCKWASEYNDFFLCSHQILLHVFTCFFF